MTQHNERHSASIMTLGIRVECQNADCDFFIIVILSVFMLTVVMLNVVTLSVDILSDVMLSGAMFVFWNKLLNGDQSGYQNILDSKPSLFLVS